MTAIDEALAAIDALKPGEKLVYQKIADSYGVGRSTLSRRHKQIQLPRETRDITCRSSTHNKRQISKVYTETN